MNIQHSSKTAEHYTPVEIIYDSRVVLGSIELDPASSEMANQYIRATRIYTETDNALEHPWKATTVFLNPPGGRIRNRSYQALFWDKLSAEYQRGNVKAAIFLAFSLELLAKRLDVLNFPVCFVGSSAKSLCVTNSGRIKFNSISESGDRVQSTAPTHGNFIVLLPSDDSQVDRFKAQFGKYGRVGKLL